MIDFFLTYQPLLSQILIGSLLALGMFFWFRSGLFSFATAGLMSIGAYSSAILTTTYHYPFWIAALLAVIITCIVSLILGYLVLRLHHMHFALATLAFSELVRLLAMNWGSMTGGSNGLLMIPDVTQLWELILAVVLVAYGVARLSGNTKYGRALSVMREDYLLAGTLGIYTNWYRLLIFVLGTVPTALAGVYQAHLNWSINPDQFGFTLMINVLMMTVLGGKSIWVGPILGAFIISILPEALRMFKQYILLINGLILLAVTVFLPDGLVGLRILKRKKPLSLQTQTSPVNSNNTADLALPILRSTKGNDNTTLLELEGINVRFGGLQVLNEVAFSVREGEVFGLIGPNGAGKTTLLNVISGVVPPTKGRLKWEGRDVTRLRPDQLSQIGISRTYQNIRLHKEISVFDNVLLGTHKSLHYGLFGTLFFSKRARKEEREARNETKSMLQHLGLDSYAYIEAGSVAYGLQRRVEVARALVSKPHLLLLDEPTSGMNEAETAEFGKVIHAIRSTGVTIVLVEHHMSLVADTCDQVLVLNFGSPITIGTPEDIQAHPEVIEAYLGIDKAKQEVVSNAGS